jgi:hypothetical protein
MEIGGVAVCDESIGTDLIRFRIDLGVMVSQVHCSVFVWRREVEMETTEGGLNRFHGGGEYLARLMMRTG